MEDVLDPLWASTFDGLEIDFARSTVGINAHAIDGRQTTRYRLECVGVSAFQYVDPEPSTDAWDYTEITAAELSRQRDGRLRVAVCLWLEERELIVVCEDVRFEASTGA